MPQSLQLATVNAHAQTSQPYPHALPYASTPLHTWQDAVVAALTDVRSDFRGHVMGEELERYVGEGGELFDNKRLFLSIK